MRMIMSHVLAFSCGCLVTWIYFFIVELREDDIEQGDVEFLMEQSKFDEEE